MKIFYGVPASLLTVALLLAEAHPEGKPAISEQLIEQSKRLAQRWKQPVVEDIAAPRGVAQISALSARMLSFARENNYPLVPAELKVILKGTSNGGVLNEKAAWTELQLRIKDYPLVKDLAAHIVINNKFEEKELAGLIEAVKRGEGVEYRLMPAIGLTLFQIKRTNPKDYQLIAHEQLNKSHFAQVWVEEQWRKNMTHPSGVISIPPHPALVYKPRMPKGITDDKSGGLPKVADELTMHEVGALVTMKHVASALERIKIQQEGQGGP